MPWGSLFDFLSLADGLSRRRDGETTWPRYLLACLIVAVLLAIGVVLVAVLFNLP